ncbi:MAG: hypothetical protein LBI61_02925 [Puniceicoccales bacterium]|jgi:hypothetical protein|nr:hypothetical protein [Puniceicoccales bacterium]
MERLSSSHQTMMVVGWLAVAFSQTLLFSSSAPLSVITKIPEDDTTQTGVPWHKSFNMKIKTKPGTRRIILAILLVRYCTMGSLINFIGSVALFGSLVMLTSGFGDARYAAKKFAAYHFFALVACVCANVFDGSSSDPSISLILRTIALGILIGAYPLGGWIDSFFSRGTSFFIGTWLILVRPILVKFLVEVIASAPDSFANRRTLFTSLALAWLSIGFVPVLFFAKTELRKLIASITVWSNGYVWLFAAYLPTENMALLVPFAITQGIFLAVISDGATALWQKSKTDSVRNFHGLFEKNYFMAVLIISSLCFLVATPIIFIIKWGILRLPNELILQPPVGVLLPAAFAHRIYKLMKDRRPEIAEHSETNDI